ncbi:hypothetical protein AAG906_024685 [Vitis piasezkii]
MPCLLTFRLSFLRTLTGHVLIPLFMLYGLGLGPRSGFTSLDRVEEIDSRVITVDRFTTAMASIQEASLRLFDGSSTWDDLDSIPVASLPAEFRMPDIERAAWSMDLDGRFSEPTNVDLGHHFSWYSLFICRFIVAYDSSHSLHVLFSPYSDPSRVRCSLRIIITHITISSSCFICLLIDIIFTLGILSFLSFLSPYHLGLRYVPCLKTTLRPWDQMSSSAASTWTGLIQLCSDYRDREFGDD